MTDLHRRIIQFVKDNNVKKTTLKSNANKFIKTLSPDDKEELQKISFYDISLYEEPHNDELFERIVLLSDFKRTIIHKIFGKPKNTIDFGKLERQVSPPLEAYKYIPYNKMDIKHSDRSYGLLFE